LLRNKQYIFIERVTYINESICFRVRQKIHFLGIVCICCDGISRYARRGGMVQLPLQEKYSSRANSKRSSAVHQVSISSTFYTPFAPIFLRQKLQSQNVSRGKLLKPFCTKKCARKELMRSTHTYYLGVNFIKCFTSIFFTKVHQQLFCIYTLAFYFLQKKKWCKSCLFNVGKIDYRTLSFVMIPTFLAFLVISLSGLENQQDIYISRVFVSVLVFFVLVPAFVIFKNEKIVLFTKHYVKSFHLFKIFDSMNSIRQIGTVCPDVNI
jgi:hypothetical protein